MKDLAGKVAVITGGGSPRGIGHATGALLAKQGMKVVLADINADALKTTVGELQSTGAEVIGVPTDVSDYASMKNLADEAFKAFGKVHVAFFNAGIGGGGTLLEPDDDTATWERVLGINLKGVLWGIKAFVPRMIEQGEHAHVLGTASGAGAIGVMYTGAGYAVTKQGVVTLMECLYGQLRDAGADIQATVVFPPLAKTNLAGDPEIMHMVQAGLQGNGVPPVLAEPEEVAQTVLEAIQSDSFWAHHDHEADARLSNNRFKAVIDWEDEMIRNRAAAIIGRDKPDSYLWGGTGRS
jgi:NAD(P)-dependent dehydrogenase (short-subunit alcohol dehydrogenase family)